MASEQTRNVLRSLGVAVTRLEEAIDEHAPVDDIVKLEEEVADRTRDVLALVERVRSRRIA